MQRKRVIAAGHRPDRLEGYTDQAWDSISQFALDAIRQRQGKIDVVYTGMAQGWEMAVAHACAALGIPFVVMAAFSDQEKFWSGTAQDRYRRLLEKAQEAITVSPGPYSPEKTREKDKLLLANGDVLLALWNGDVGGTERIIREANSRGIIVANLWPFYEKYVSDRNKAIAA